MDPKTHEIRADYDRDTIVVYQAYKREIASPAVETNRFHPPFSFHRMTWIKPSFLWLMARSNWGTKSGQECILGIRILRSEWENALSQSVLTSPKRSVYKNREEWREQFEKTHVHVQWDPERNLRGTKLNHRSIQVGISRFLIQEYVDEWIVDISDYTPLVRNIHRLCRSGKYQNAKRLLPNERVYPLPVEIGHKIGMS